MAGLWPTTLHPRDDGENVCRSLPGSFVFALLRSHTATCERIPVTRFAALPCLLLLASCSFGVTTVPKGYTPTQPKPECTDTLGVVVTDGAGALFSGWFTAFAADLACADFGQGPDRPCHKPTLIIAAVLGAVSLAYVAGTTYGIVHRQRCVRARSDKWRDKTSPKGSAQIGAKM